jgi:hypothetical protein
MSRFARSALLGAALLLSASVGIDAEGNAASSSTWTIGLARLESAGGGESSSILLSTIPRLVIGDLPSFPARRPFFADRIEAEMIKSARGRFAAGTELATKLDERASGFLDPSTAGAEKSYGLKTADKAVRESSRKLKETLGEGQGPELEPEEEGEEGPDLVVKLWDQHAKGTLIDPPGAEVAKAAKAAGVDFLVSGSVSILESGYATVTLHGFDANLSREVFSYTSHCAVDDPEPLAKDIAERIERFCAGREFARIELKSEPEGAELFVDGKPIYDSARVAYLYRPGVVHINANSSGYESASIDIPVGLGERRRVELKLKAKSTGTVALGTDPMGASISLDSVPLGNAPLDIPLDGTRKVLYVSDEGMEPQTAVLPASGDSKLDIKLQPSDGIGLSGRIEAAKDDFYWAFGWFALSVPITTVTYGIYNGYDEAYQRSESPTLAYSRWNASRALMAACALTATTSVFMIIRLVKYLKTAR